MIPRSVIKAEINRFGVTSKAGLRAVAPTGTTLSPSNWISSTSPWITFLDRDFTPPGDTQINR